MKKSRKWIVAAAAIAVVIAATGAWIGTRPRTATKGAGQAYELATVEQGLDRERRHEQRHPFRRFPA